jgi:phage-related protein
MKRAYFIGSSREDIKKFPKGARQEAGYAIYLAQEGDKAINAVPMTGFGGASVLEVIIPEEGDAFRAVYTVKFYGAIYVLHAFQKKSTIGGKTPRGIMTLIKARLKEAKEHYEAYHLKEEKRRAKEKRSR